jgi:hypothetical protein
MKSALILPLVLLIAGCKAPQHSYYTAERSHIQRDQIIAESNRFPTPGNRDTYYWYQKDKSRNMPTGPHEGISGFNYYGSQAPDYSNNNSYYGSWPGYYSPYGARW